MSAPFDPKAYVEMLMRLRPDAEHNEIEIDVDEYVRCAGLDVAAGEAAAEALEAGLDHWSLAELLARIVDGRIENHPSEEERTHAKLVLALLPGLRARPELMFEEALDSLLDLFSETWKGRLVELARRVIHVAATADRDGGVDIDFANALVRAFVRDVYELGGLDLVRIVVAQLRQALASTATA